MVAFFVKPLQTGGVGWSEAINRNPYILISTKSARKVARAVFELLLSLRTPWEPCATEALTRERLPHYDLAQA